MQFFSKSKSSNVSNSFQDWLGISKIEDGKILLKTQKSIRVLKVLPINFKLKSEMEQNAILIQYKNFLSNINSKIQIIISSRKTNLTNHIKKISKISKENPKIMNSARDYIELIERVISEKGTITKEFFIVLPEAENIENEILKIKELLTNCGNDVDICSKEDIKLLISCYTNKRTLNLIGGVR
jgi:hypothetical protein